MELLTEASERAEPMLGFEVVMEWRGGHAGGRGLVSGQQLDVGEWVD